MSPTLRIAPETVPDESTPIDAEQDAFVELDRDASLETVLAAWNDATLRLQRTHELLQAEVSRLSDELEEKNRELARENRLADLGRMASHVAHEVRNSLVPVALYLSLLNRKLSGDAESLNILTKVEAGFTALNATVNDLLSFTSHREPHWGVFSLRDLVSEVRESLGPQLEAQSIVVDLDVPLGLAAYADREMVRRALLNLVLNAIDAMPSGGELVITAVATSAGLEIEVADSGEGIDRAQLNRLFDPFYTTKSSGTGLGLAIVQRIAESHGGKIDATNCAEGGAAFTLSLPRRVMGAAA